MLRRNNKTSFSQAGIGTKLYFEVHEDPSIDDVVAFMAQSEAQRLYVLSRKGFSRDTQTPSDELKSFLMNLED